MTAPTPSDKLIAAAKRAMIADDAAEAAADAAKVAESAWKRKVSEAIRLARRESGTDMGRGNYLSRPAADLYAEARRIAGEQIEAAKAQEATR